MKCVIDASVAIKWALDEADSDKARALRDEQQARIHEFLVHDVFPAEVAHALTKAERRRLIGAGEAEILLSGILVSLPPIWRSLPILPRAVEIASAARIGLYDCLYVALAEREQCELVTADDRLVKNLRQQFRSSRRYRRCRESHA